MPVKLGEASILTSPISLVRIWALVSGCLTFSLGAYTTQVHPPLKIVKTFCMVAWCFHFTFTLLIILVEFIQFQSLVPVSWKNLPVSISTMGMLVYLTTSVGFPWLLINQNPDDKTIAATFFSCLTFLSYASETHLIRLQSREQKGYMASAPGLLKVFQVFGGCVMLLLVKHQHQNEDHNPDWRFWLSVAIYIFCFLMSLGTVLVMIGDCAGRCLLPFDRLLAVFSHLGVILYIAVTVISFSSMLNIQGSKTVFEPMAGSIVTCLILIAYTVDLAFSIKLLCDRT